jgi:allantoinase
VRADLAVRARRAVVGGRERPATVVVRGGTVVDVFALDEPVDAAATAELADDEVLLPGLVDTHVHVDEPGRTDWEGFDSATRAAAAGGVTTVVDMPLNSLPPTLDVEALDAKRAAAQGRCHVDVAFWGGVVPANLGRLAPLHVAGVLGFKCFLADSGVEEFPALSPDQLEEALSEAKALDTLVLVHAEDPATLSAAPAPAGPRYADFLASRPPGAEDRAVERVVAAAERTGARVHVVHVSSAAAADVVAAARARGVRVSAETCPHYLALTAEEIRDGDTAAKCCPPVREAANAERLWEALERGAVTAVVSDHSPSTPELKLPADGDFAAAWGGISSLQLGLPVVWTAARARGYGLADVAAWMAEGPAALAGLRAKGRIAVGADADLVALAPDETFVVDARVLHHRHPVTPYDGRTLSGVVRTTWLRGRRTDGVPRGRLLTRGAP